MSLSQGSVISVHAMNTILVIFTRPALMPLELAITLPLFRKSCYSQGNTYTHYREPWGLPGLAPEYVSQPPTALPMPTRFMLWLREDRLCMELSFRILRTPK